MNDADREAAAWAAHHQQQLQQHLLQPFAAARPTSPGPDHHDPASTAAAAAAAAASAHILAQPPALPAPRSPRHAPAQPPDPQPPQPPQQPPGVLGALRGAFAAAAEQHLQRLASQLLASEGVGGEEARAWAPLASQLAVRAAVLVDPHLHLLATTRSVMGYSVREEGAGPRAAAGDVAAGAQSASYSSGSSRVRYPDPCDRIKVRDCGAVRTACV